MLCAIKTINKASGNFRLVEEGDRHLLVDWIQAFAQEALGDNEPKSDSQLCFNQ